VQRIGPDEALLVKSIELPVYLSMLMFHKEASITKASQLFHSTALE
jgi:hypothetical protein